jgi:hypothetical protein
MPEGAVGGPRRRFITEHSVDAQQTLWASVAWNGDDWTVTVNNDVLPDCCSTIEEAFSAAEKEMARRFPNHTCLVCKEWQHAAEA